MKVPIIDRLEVIRKRSGLSLEAVAERSTFSSSTIRRWWRGDSVPSVEDLETLAESMGGSIYEIFVEVGKQEMLATQAIDYQGATAMVAQYEARLEAMQEKIQLVERHAEDKAESDRQHYDRVVTYLKDENASLHRKNRELMDKLAAADQHVKDSDRRRYTVFWGMLALCFAMLAIGVAIYPPWA